MWIRKTKAETRRYAFERARKIIVYGTLVSTLLWLVRSRIDHKVKGTVDNWVSARPLTLDSLLYDGSCFLIVCFVIFLIIAYIANKIYGSSGVIVCLSCEKASNRTNSTVCECGGELVDIELLEWKETDVDSKASKG